MLVALAVHCWCLKLINLINTRKAHSNGKTLGKSLCNHWCCRVAWPLRSRLQCSGIGFETALAFAAEGACVIMADVNEDAGLAALQKVKQMVSDSQILFIQCDVSSDESVSQMICTGERHFGKINVIFNNAGIMHADDGDATSTEDKIWDLTMNINAKSILYGCRHGIPALRRAGGGSIINTASFVARVGAATSQIACILAGLV